MCLGKNSAHHAIHYLNAQLGSLWENAVECRKGAGKDLRAAQRIGRYDFALAEFFVAGKNYSSFTLKEDMLFSASFEIPRLEFICNHEAVLYLKIKEGHFNRDFDTKNTSFTRSRNVQLHDMEVAFRVEFAIKETILDSSKVGNGAHIVHMLVLKLADAQLASKVNISGGREALAFYLKSYLKFLVQAGYHVLFSLPDFDDNRLDLKIDYSVLSHRIRNADFEIDNFHGISIEKINRYISAQWLKTVMDMDIRNDHHMSCIAEYKSIYTDLKDEIDYQFHVKFGAPSIKALCKHEVILTFKIDEVLVYESDDFSLGHKHEFKGWEVAVIFAVDKVVKDTTTYLKLKLDDSVRFCEIFSTFNGLDITEKMWLNFKDIFTTSFLDYYVKAFQRARFHIIYIDTPVAPDHFGGELTPGTIKETEMFNFDFIQVITVESILEHFRLLLHESKNSAAMDANCMGSWSHGTEFTSTFDAIRVRLLSHEKAMVYVQLQEGSVKPLGSTTSQKFNNWTIAFEVALKLLSHEKTESSATSSWVKRFKASLAWKKYGSDKDVTLKHLCLDFTSAEFIFDQSRFSGLYLGSHSAVSAIKASVHYLKTHYLPHVTSHGHHILNTLPIWKPKTNSPRLGLTDVKFQVYSKIDYDRNNCHHVVRQVFEPVIVLYGMTQFRPLPSQLLEYSSEWFMKSLTKREFSFGTVAISKKLFLEEEILRKLAKVNASTTIIPVFSSEHNGINGQNVKLLEGVEGKDWVIGLTSFEKRNYKGKRKCEWEINNGPESAYKWDYTDKWSYEHESACNDADNGLYSLRCETKNYLDLPTTFNHGCLDIDVRGESTIDISFKGAVKNWTHKFVSKWSVTLAMESTSHGLNIRSKNEHFPKHELSHHHTHGTISVEKIVDVKSMDDLIKVNLREFTEELENSYGKVWGHCYRGVGGYALSNPVFNNSLDILFELLPYVSGGSRKPIMPTPSGLKVGPETPKSTSFAVPALQADTTKNINGNGNAHTSGDVTPKSQLNKDANGNAIGNGNGTAPRAPEDTTAKTQPKKDVSTPTAAKGTDAPAPPAVKGADVPAPTAVKGAGASAPTAVKGVDSPAPTPTKGVDAHAPTPVKGVDASAPTPAKAVDAHAPAKGVDASAPTPAKAVDAHAPAKAVEVPALTPAKGVDAHAPTPVKGVDAPAPTPAKGVDAPAPTPAKSFDAPAPTPSKGVDASAPAPPKKVDAHAPAPAKGVDAHAPTPAKEVDAHAPTPAKGVDAHAPTPAKDVNAPSAAPIAPK